MRLPRFAVFFTERFLAATDLRFVAFFRFFAFIAISDSYVLIVVLRGDSRRNHRATPTGIKLTNVYQESFLSPPSGAAGASEDAG